MDTFKTIKSIQYTPAETRKFKLLRFEGAQVIAPRQEVTSYERTTAVVNTIFVILHRTAPAAAPALRPPLTAVPRLAPQPQPPPPQPQQPQQQQQQQQAAAQTPESRLAALEAVAKAQLSLGTAQLPAAAEARIAALERRAQAPAAPPQWPPGAEARLATLEAQVQALAAPLQLPAAVEARIAALEGQVQAPAAPGQLPAAAEGRLAVLEGLARAQLTLGTSAQLSAAAEARIAALEARAPAAPLQLPAAAEARLAALEAQAGAPAQLPPAAERRLANLERTAHAPPQLPAAAEARLLALEGLRGEVGGSGDGQCADGVDLSIPRLLAYFCPRCCALQVQSVRELLESLLARQENLPNKRVKRE